MLAGITHSGFPLTSQWKATTCDPSLQQPSSPPPTKLPSFSSDSTQQLPTCQPANWLVGGKLPHMIPAKAGKLQGEGCCPASSATFFCRSGEIRLVLHLFWGGGGDVQSHSAITVMSHPQRPPQKKSWLWGCYCP